MVTESGSLHDRLFVMDGLSAAELTESYVTETLPEAGIDAMHKTVIAAGDGFDDAIESIKSLQRDIRNWPGVNQARTVSDLTEDGLSIVFGFQDTTPLEDDPENVAIFKQLGVRIIQLTYNARNRSGNGCTERVDGGLSYFGIDVIEAIESHGLLLDLSHVGPKSAADALEVATKPTAFTHSNPSAVHDHPRNISDDLILAAVETGGTVGVNAYPAFVGEDPTIDDLIDHIEYLVDLVGADHVTLGLDFIDNLPADALTVLEEDPAYPDPPYDYPPGLESAASMPNVTAALVERGFDETEIVGIMGENLLRLYREVWA